MMLGVRRAGVSVTASVLQKAGAISYNHGSMTVANRSILKGAACECYGIIRQQFERLCSGERIGIRPQPRTVSLRG